MEEKSKRRNAKALIFIVFIVIALAIGIWLKGKNSFFAPSYHPRPNPGQPAPDFAFHGLDGRTITLADYKGKVVILNIWATWCPSCVEEMPSLEKLSQELKGANFQLLAVSIDAQGADAVAPFMRNHRLTFPALLDEHSMSQRLYGITGVPESFIINKKGIVDKVVIGPVDWDAPEVVRYFRELIQEP